MTFITELLTAAQGLLRLSSPPLVLQIAQMFAICLVLRERRDKSWRCTPCPLMPAQEGDRIHTDGTELLDGNKVAGHRHRHCSSESSLLV